MLRGIVYSTPEIDTEVNPLVSYIDSGQATPGRISASEKSKTDTLYSA
jgi:hypothetical protein